MSRLRGISPIGQEAANNAPASTSPYYVRQVSNCTSAHTLDKRLSTRVMRKLWPSSYFRLAEQGLAGRIQSVVEQNKAEFVFLNQVQLASVAVPLRGLLHQDCKIIVLSHGLESTDLLHALRLKNDPPLVFPGYLLGEQLLGDTLLRESSYRSSLDLILCLSPFDVELENWLGARRVEWLPRTVTSAPLSWKSARKPNRICGDLGSSSQHRRSFALPAKPVCEGCDGHSDLCRWRAGPRWPPVDQALSERGLSGSAIG